MTPSLNLPLFEFKIRPNGSDKEIWDEFRKQYVILTPEEWVRQNFLRYLSDNLNYPKSLIKLEMGIQYNQLQKRPDIIAYDNMGQPLMVVECKSTKVKISKAVFEQAATYNKIIRAKYLVVTNGLQHFCCKQNFEIPDFQFLDSIPEYEL